MDPQQATDILCNYLWKTRRPLYTSVPIIYENVYLLLKQGASRSLTCYDRKIPPVLVAILELHDPKLVELLLDDTFDRNMRIPYMYDVWDDEAMEDIFIYRYYTIENILLIHYYEAQFRTGVLEDKLVERYHRVVPLIPYYVVYPESDSESESNSIEDDNNNNNVNKDNDNKDNDNKDNDAIGNNAGLDIDYDIVYYYKEPIDTSDTCSESETVIETTYRPYNASTIPEKETRDISDCSSTETPNKKRLVRYSDITIKNTYKHVPTLKQLKWSSYIISRIEAYCSIFNIDFKSLETKEEDVPDDVSKNPLG
jgi:hypothetical protein